MEQSEILIRILLSIVFGAILGLETETRQIESKGEKKALEEESKRLGGIRTYTIISLTGGLAGIFFYEGFEILTYSLLFAVILFLLAAYILNVQLRQAFGLTTEIAVIITFLLGFLVTSNIVVIAIPLVVLVLLAFFLSQKRGIGTFLHKIEHKELIDIVKFGLISAVILPILPNQNYYVYNLIKLFNEDALAKVSNDIKNLLLLNPFGMWLIVVLISGFSLTGFLLGKFIDQKKAFVFTGFFGGFVSSTAITISLATKSKQISQKAQSSTLAGSAVIANAVSFISVSILILVANDRLFEKIFPGVSLMLVVGVITGMLIILTEKKSKIIPSEIKIDNETFSIIPAIKFVGVVIIIKVLIQVSQIIDFESILYLTSSLSGMLGLDAPSIAVADLQKQNLISLTTATNAFLLANTVNFIAKGLYGLILGSKDYAFKLGLGLFITFLASLVIII